MACVLQDRVNLDVSTSLWVGRVVFPQKPSNDAEAFANTWCLHSVHDLY